MRHQQAADEPLFCRDGALHWYRAGSGSPRSARQQSAALPQRDAWAASGDQLASKLDADARRPAPGCCRAGTGATDVVRAGGAKLPVVVQSLPRMSRRPYRFPEDEPRHRCRPMLALRRWFRRRVSGSLQPAFHHRGGTSRRAFPGNQWRWRNTENCAHSCRGACSWSRGFERNRGSVFPLR